MSRRQIIKILTAEGKGRANLFRKRNKPRPGQRPARQRLEQVCFTERRQPRAWDARPPLMSEAHTKLAYGLNCCSGASGLT